LREYGLSKADKDFNTESEQRLEIFTWKPKLGKITERRENLLLSRSYSEFFRALLWLVVNCWSGGGWNDGEIDVTVVIFTCEIIITAAIVGA